MIGGLGTSGDTFHANHHLALGGLRWEEIMLQIGFALMGGDGIIYNVINTFGYAECGYGEKGVAITIGSGR